MRTVVAADRPLVGRGIEAALSRAHVDWPMRSARSAQECLRIVDSWGPDLVVLNVDLPAQARASFCDDLHRRQVRVVYLVDGPACARAALAHGTDAVVAEAEGLSGILTAVDSVALGHAYVSPPLLREVIKGLVARAAEDPQATPPDVDVARLSERERAVLGLLRAGYDRNSIARELGIAPQTAKTHVRHVLQKLGVHSRRDAAAIAERAGIPKPRNGSYEPSEITSA